MIQNSSHGIRCALLVLSIAASSGCGDYPAGVGADLEDVETRGASVGLEGRTVYLRRRSSSCGLPPSNPLIAEVGGGVEFPAMQTRMLEPPCLVGPTPGVDVSVEGGSLLFDFANVEQPGLFPEASFEGYDLSFARRCGDIVIRSVSVDTARSSVDAGAVRASHHYDRISVDFQALSYDESAFVKVDLDLVDVDCL